MRRILFGIASVIAILTFSCDTTETSFDDAVPELYTLTTNVSPEGSGTVSPAGGEYVSGTRIEIEARPAEGYIFERWTGDLTGSVNPDSLFFTRNRNVTAHFIPRDYPLNIEIIGEGTVTEEVISQSVEETDTVPDRLTPTNSQIEPSSDRTPDGHESSDYELQSNTVQSSQENTYTVQQNLTASQEHESVTVRLTAEPAEGWFFDRWEGDLTGSENPATIEVDEEKNVTAVFEQEEQDQFTLNVTVEGEGSVNIDPDQTAYEAGDEVTLTAVPAADWNFTEWQGDLAGSTNPETIVMESDKDITALFELPGAPVLEITRQPAETTAGTAINPAPAVQLTNGQGDPLPGVDVSVTLNNNSFALGSTTTTETNSNGTAVFDNLVIETAATGYTLIFDADEPDVTNVTSELFDVTAAAADPESTTADVPDGVAGEATVITISVFDPYDNPVSGVANDLSVTVSGDNNASPAATETETTGEYTASYTPTTAGEDEVAIALNGTPIVDSPFTSTVTTSDVSSANSTVTADPDELQVGNSSTITIELRDDQNNPVSGLENAIELTNLGNATAGTIEEDGDSGIYTTEITNETPEEISLTVIADGVTLDDTPIIIFLPGDADSIEIVSGNNQSGMVGETLDNPLVVRVTDAFDNPVAGETVEFEITETPTGALGQSLSETSVPTGSNGQASTELTLGSMPGEYKVDASAGAAGTVTFTAQADLGEASLMAVLQQPSNTTAGEVISPAPEVQITDDQQNPIEGTNVTVTVNGAEFTGGSTTQASTDQNGLTTFNNLVIVTAGSGYTLTFNADASGVDDVNSDPFDVAADAADASSSSANVPDGTAGSETTITITLLDQYDNPVSGEAGNLSVTVTGANNESPSVAETGTPGEYTASYTPVNAGTDNIEITLNGSPITGSPFTSEVSTSDISASNSTVTASPSELAVGNTSTVTVELRDDSNNPIGGLTDTDFSINVSGNGSAGSITETSTAGTYQFDVNNTTVQQVTVTVTADGVTLQDTADIIFEAGDVDIVAIQTQPGETVAGQPIAGPPLIRLLDEFGNRVPDVEVTVSEQSGQAFASGDLTVISNSSGESTFDNLVITPAGQYNLIFTASGKTVTSNAFNIIPADPDPTETTAAVPSGSAGDQTQITITVNDAFGNRVEGVAADLSVTIEGANAGASVDPVNDEGNGVYSTGYTPTATGTDQVVIELNGSPIQGSPYESNVITSDAEDVTITQQPLQTTAGQVIAGPPSVLVTDDLGNPVENVEVNVSEQGGQSFAGGTTPVLTDNNGLAEFSDLVIEQAGTYNLVFNAIGASENAVSDPFDVVAAAADNLSEVSGDNQTGQVDETLQPFVVQLEDSFGNPVPDETVTFTISSTPDGAAGQQLSNESIDTDADGQAFTTLTLGDTAGIYEVTASSSAGNVIFSADAEAGPASSFEFDTISSPQTAGQTFSISLTASDSSENIAAGYNGTASLTTTAGTIDPAAIDFTNGTASTNVTVSDAGSNQTITATDGDVTGTSNSFDVQSGGVDANNSTVSADPGELQAGQNSTVTIELRDGSNNPVSGLTDTDFSIVLTGSATAGTVTEGAAGTYSVNVDNNAAETITVTVTADGVTLSDSPSVTFTAADPASLSIVSGEDQAGTVSEALADPFVVQVTDQFGNPVEGETVNFAIDQTPTGASGQSLSQTSVLTDEAGEASSVLTLGDTPGTYTVDATSGSLTAVTFSANAEIGEVSQMTVTVQPSETTAGEIISPAPAVEVTDDVGNPVEGINVTVSERGGYMFDNGTLTVATNSSGIASFGDLMIQAANNYTLVFNADASGVDDVASNEFNVIADDADPANTTAIVPDGTAGNPTTITITVLDQFDNPVSGEAENLSITVSGANIDSPSATETGTTGEYTASYTPTTAGEDQVAITLNGTPIVDSPFTSNVTTSDISATNSTVTADPTNLQAGNNSTVTVLLRDGSNNPIGGLTETDFSVGVSGDGTSDNVTETSTSGTYEFTVTNTTAEEVTVTVTASGVQLQDTPQITYTAAEPARMIISTQPENVIAGQLIPGPPSVTLEDEFDNLVPDVAVTVNEQGGQSFASGTLTVQTDGSGLAAFSDLVITAAGQYNLVFTGSSGETATSNAFNVGPADADAASSTANVPNGAAGDQTDITITVEDEFGNRVAGVAGDLAVNVSGANDGATVDPVSDDGNGIYTTGYTPTSTGTDEIAITLNGTDIAGSPYTSEVVTSDAENVAVDTQPQQTVAGQPIAGPPAALVTDNLTNPVSGVEVIAGLQSGTFDSGTTSVNSDGSGIAAFSDLVINTAGTYTLEFKAVGVTDDAISEPFDIIAADAADIAIESGDDQTGTVTEPLGNAFVVRIADPFDNPVEGETVTFAISSEPADATGSSLTETSVNTDADGFASTLLTLGSRTGTYQVTASVTDVGDVTFTAQAEAGPATAFEFDTISSPQIAGQPFTISLTALDDQENTAGSYIETVSLSASEGSISPETAEFTSGTASLEVTLSQAGSDRTITATDGTISETSNTFEVETGGVDASNSSASADPVQLQAGQSSQLTIELRDGSNNAVSGLVDDDFTIGVSGDGTAGTVSETGTPGTYTSDVINQTAETVTVTVTANSVTIDDTPSIEFTPADADSVVQVSGNNQTGTVLQQLSEDFVVRVIDPFDNPVEGETVTFAITGHPDDATGQSLSVESANTNSDGFASTRLTLGDEPGTYNVDGSVTGLNTVTFSADAEIGEASQMSITAQPGQTTAGNEISPSPQITVTDDAANPVEGVNVTVSEQGGATFDAGTTTQSTNTSGVATFNDLMFESADTYTLVFDADAAGVANVASDPFDVVPAAGDPVNSSADVPDGVAGEATNITITVLDEFNNPVPGESGDLSVSVTDGPNSGTTFTSITDNGDGTYSTSYTPDNDGTDEVTITLAGISITGSPFTSEVGTGDVSAVNSGVTADPTELQAGNSSLVTVDLRDGSNNPIPGLSATDFSINITGNSSAGPITETSTDGTYQFTVSNETAETVTVTVAAEGTTLQDTPEITFTAADPDLMLITMEPSESVAGEPIEGPPAVRITDEYDNPVPNAEVNVSEQSGEPFSTGSTATINTDSQGFATFSNIAIENVGQYNLVFSSTGVTNRTSNAFNVIAAGPDAAQTTADVPNGSAGDQTNITITVRDEFGNRVEGVAGQLAVTIEGENAGATVASITESGNGVYTTGYTPESTGTDQVVIEINGTGIQGSPYESTVATSDADNVAINQEPLQTIAGNVIEGPPSVVVTDEFDNVVSGIEVTVREQSGAGFDAGTLTVSTNTSGIADFSDLQLNTAGSYTLEFDAVGVATDAVSGIFEVIAADGDPAQTTALVPDGTSNESTTITIIVQDQFGNTVEGAAADLSVSVTSGPNQGATVAAIQDDGDGSYSTSYTPAESGTDEITITLGGTQISNSPYTSEVSAGPATTLQMNQQPTETTAGNAISPAPSVLLTDSEGNEVSGVDVTAILSSNDFTLASTITVSTNQNGLAVFDNLVIETAATGYSITFDADAAGVDNVTSDLFDVDPGPVSSTASSASATSPHTADGIDASAVTVNLTDANGNVISGLTDADFTVDVGANAAAGTVSESITDGTYEFTVTNTTAETVTVVITADGVTLEDQPSIVFE